MATGIQILLTSGLGIRKIEKGLENKKGKIKWRFKENRCMYSL
jgi:hypothetical protein